MTSDTLNTLLPRCDRADYMPGKKAFPVLLSAFTDGDADAQKSVTRALLRAGAAALPSIMRALADADGADGTVRARIARCLGRFAADNIGEARVDIERLLADADEHTRRAAVQAVGQWKDLEEEDETRLEALMLSMWPVEPLPTQRALIRSLGRLGGKPTQALLKGDLPDDPEIERLADEARAFVTRRLSRQGDSHLDGTRPLRWPVTVRATCKPGLEDLVIDELRELLPPNWPTPGARPAPGVIRFPFQGRPDALFRSRVMIDFTIELPRQFTGEASPGEAAASLLGSAQVQAIFRAMTEGQIRYRLQWSGTGKQRQDTRACVAALTTRAPAMVNDPSERLWDIEVRLADGKMDVLLRPLFEDPRFAWRVGDIPAASHPTLAAALVRIAGIDKTDHVWDPFAGSGLELIERALAGPYARMIGTDVDPKAIEVARANMKSAGIKAALSVAKAETFEPGLVDVVITNPPLGSRVADGASVAELMAAFVPHIASILRPGGRMAWLTRNPRKTDPLLAKAGLGIVYSQAVDLGGVFVTIQRVEKGDAN